MLEIILNEYSKKEMEALKVSSVVLIGKNSIYSFHFAVFYI